MIIADRCYRLTIALKSMSTKIPYEDAQVAVTQLIQCAANVLSVRHLTKWWKISSIF